jgi:hypothetical protein
MKSIFIIAICLFILITLPIVLWFSEPNKECHVAIIDKTVPNETFREHQGLVFLLNYLKYKNGFGDTYDLRKDFYGFYPNEEKRGYKIKPLPTDYDGYDMIYLADTYGVYEKDFPWVEKEREGSRSPLVYGGLDEQEWLNIHNRLEKDEKSLFIAEYNAFASPTGIEVMESVTAFLGVDWDGWVGRYFDEVDYNINLEIPQWVIDEFGESWQYSGSGFLLVNDFTSEILVLEGTKHVLDKGINLTFTKEGEDFFGLEKSPNYHYWFDIVTPERGSTALAYYNWNLTDSGKEFLEENGIPTEFAAVIKNERGSCTSYYFAGDYNDIGVVPRLYKFRGLPKLYSVLEINTDSDFYWSTYFPMMDKILETFVNLLSEETASTETSISTEPDEPDDKIRYYSRIKDDSFQILRDGEWEPITIKGVNIGMGKPGVFPGEAAITEEEYYRWFEYIGDMNANVIRIYTLHAPGFYNALLRYNETHDEKLYLIHGVWMNEEMLLSSYDAFEEDNVDDFQQEMKRTVDAIHGNIIFEERQGHASGFYSSDISQYVIAYILGIEWDPYMVENTNDFHSSVGEYNGNYFETKDAKPFEHFLAQQMDIIAEYELENYNSMRPISFSNWPTTDILEHPSNFQDSEDRVGVDPNVIYIKGDLEPVGEFASYHVYPYYPDFLNFEEKYRNYIDHRGEHNNYAGYLNHLNSVHRLPILIAEFGIPASRGLAHENPFGWNQGFASEKEQGETICRLYEDILEEDMLGGLLFAWQDEWFKRTWNTVDYDNPDRRPFWSNVQTNEQRFGLLCFDRHKIKVDGDTEEWQTEPLYKKDQGVMKGLYVDHDETYLYIRLDYSNDGNGYPVILLDVVPDQGNFFVAENDSIKFSNGLEYLVTLTEEEPRIIIDQYYDLFAFMCDYYAYHSFAVEKPLNNSGIFSQIHYILSMEYTSYDGDILMPFTSYETGRLREGNANPESKDYDSLADFYMSDEGILELRIPWLLIQSRDPSMKEFMGDLYKDGMGASKFVDEIYIGALYVDDQGTVLDSFLSMKDGVLSALSAYSWENWEMPEYTERLKQSYYIVQDFFKDY